MKRRIVRRRVVHPTPPVFETPPPAFVPSHREETRVSPNGTVFRVSVPLNHKGEPYTAEENLAFFRSLNFDPEIMEAVSARIEAAREAERNAPDDKEAGV